MAARCAKRLVLLGALGAASAGCVGTSPLARPDVPAPGVTQASYSADAPAHPELAEAHALLKAGELAKAQRSFNTVAENKKISAAVLEEARFYEAECMYAQDEWPSASDTYHRVLLDFAGGVYRERCCQRLYVIAEFWLDDTRKEIQEEL